MSASLLTEELGPRARARVKVATVVSLALLVALVAWILVQFTSEGVFTWEDWKPFTSWSDSWEAILTRGLPNTIKAAVTAMVLAILMGGVLALGRMSRNLAVRTVSRSLVEFFRSIPVLLAILFMFLAAPSLIGVRLSSFTALVAALTVYNGAVLAEIFRAGILSLPKGQTEAAQAIGLTYWQSQFLVILPQAVRRMIPAIVAQLATATKDTALGFIIGYEELLRIGQRLGEFHGAILQGYFVVAVIYVIMIFGLSRLARRLEVSQRRKLGAGAIHVAGGPEDLDGLAEDAENLEFETKAMEAETQLATTETP